jgi:23S rRNA (adenine2030-N6)-methyltransferase
MNYRHAFHAGNFADVMKHIILTRLIQYLKLKPAAFRVIDTHAGIGRYDLTGDEAQRSPEWKSGIQKLLDKGLPGPAAELVAPYIAAVRSENRGQALTAYPGSPLLARKLFRPQDRLSALELHPDDIKQLKTLFAGDVQVRATGLDGWLALGAYVPPKEKRGIVLVDPPFEEDGEWQRLVEGLRIAHRKWATGLYALWYPLKERREINAFVTDLKSTNIARMLRAELLVDAPRDGTLFGSGMILVNPPFTLENELNIVLPALARLFGEGRGSARVEWIRGEN